MPFTKNTLDELTQEFQRLQDKNAKLQNDLRGLTVQLSQVQQRMSGIQMIIAGEERSQNKSVPDNGKAVFEEGQSLSKMTFRDAVRTVMKSEKEPLRPIEVAQIMKKAGMDTKMGKTDLSSRVTVELHKLAKIGELSRADGKYMMIKR